jgi:ferredoxin
MGKVVDAGRLVVRRPAGIEGRHGGPRPGRPAAGMIGAAGVVGEAPMDQCWTLTVDRDTCMGSGICAATAPKHFQLEKGRSRPIEKVISPDDLVLDAAETCPSEAITVHDAAGHQLAPEPL